MAAVTCSSNSAINSGISLRWQGVHARVELDPPVAGVSGSAARWTTGRARIDSDAGRSTASVVARRYGEHWFFDLDGWGTVPASRTRHLITGSTQKAQVCSAAARPGLRRDAPLWEQRPSRSRLRAAQIDGADFEFASLLRPLKPALSLRIALLVTARGLQALQAAIRSTHSSGKEIVWTRAEMLSYVLALTRGVFIRSRATAHIHPQLVAVRTLTQRQIFDGCGVERWTHWLQTTERELRLDALSLHAWRRAQRADAVIVLDNMERGPEHTRIRGLAPHLPRLRGNGSIEFARLALVDARAAMTRYTLAHELGHLLGLDHAPAYRAADSLTAFAQAPPCAYPDSLAPYARGWQSPALLLQTVMGDLGPGINGDYDIAPIWSEPGVGWLGESCRRDDSSGRGVHGVADEARFISEIAPHFIRWRQRAALASQSL